LELVAGCLIQDRIITGRGRAIFIQIQQIFRKNLVYIDTGKCYPWFKVAFFIMGILASSKKSQTSHYTKNLFIKLIIPQNALKILLLNKI
jgi:hypothetical protein